VYKDPNLSSKKKIVGPVRAVERLTALKEKKKKKKKPPLHYPALKGGLSNGWKEEQQA
jgi:hypothetical protein